MGIDRGDIRLFALNASRAQGQRIANRLGLELASHEEREFEGGEHKARPLVNVRGRDVFVVQSLQGEDGASANDKLCRLLFFIGALKDASAEKVTAVVPYLCYARKDRKSRSRDPVTTRYVAALFEAVGTDRVVTLDVHNLAAFQNAFRCRTDHLEARNLFVEHFRQGLPPGEVVVLSPDVGGMKRAEAFREALVQATGRAAAIGFMEKQRASGVVSGERLFAEVEGRHVVIIDDLISSGTTVARAAAACRAKGASTIQVAATHGAFAEAAGEILGASALQRVAITDSVPPLRKVAERLRGKLDVVETAPLFAEAIKRIHEGGSIAELLDLA
jgi:ribose-phosphate pyrophosphokinase